jgi:tartrate dehydrogenase/decarboxylase/D-malate dehydrogenase
MREYRIAAIPADGIGPEVIEAGVTVLKALAEQRGDMTRQVAADSLRHLA